MRETVESIAIAFVLAFLFKTFQAEAYVIPTGSMAPTLYGRHKEIVCTGCEFPYAVGASSEMDQDSGLLIPGKRITSAQCPNCRLQMEVRNAPAFNGDRILVNKQIPSYKRFDVVVFKNPEEGHVNYIKRLIGLPGETIRIVRGDIWARRNDSETARWEIQRKEDPEVQNDIQLTVYDDNYPARVLLESGWQERWIAAEASTADGAVGGWLEVSDQCSVDREERQYRFENGGESYQWIRYRHYVPTSSDWRDAIEDGQLRRTPTPSLITDACSFNASSLHDDAAYWVGDLTIQGTLTVEKAADGSRVMIELCEGLFRYQCEIDLQTGVAEVSVISQEIDRTNEKAVPVASGETDISGAGEYEFCFANVDNRVCLWIDGDLVAFDKPLEFDRPFLTGVELPTQRDLAPCGIAVRQASATVSGLVVKRDIYYQNEAYVFDEADGMVIQSTARHVTEVGEVLSPYEGHPSRQEQQLIGQLQAPEGWGQTYAEGWNQHEAQLRKYTDYVLADDEYLMFGDNSPASKDSRLFDYYSRPLSGVNSHRYAVREKDLIGKALFIFWPHAVPFLNDGQGYGVWSHKQGSTSGDGGITKVEDYPSLRFPFYPNFSRMKKIR